MRWRRDGSPPARRELAATFQGLPPCRGDTAKLARDLAARYVEALAAGEARRLRLAADRLLDDAVRERLVAETLVAVQEAAAPTRPDASAIHQVLVALLGEAGSPTGEGLRKVLAAPTSPALEAALLREVGRRRQLRHHPAVAKRAAASPSAAVRRALAEAAGEDGDRVLLALLPDLLLDADRDVRLAALVPLVRRAPQAMAGYDPDGSPAARAEAAEVVRAALR